MATVESALEKIMAGRSAGKCETDVLDFKEEKSSLREAWSDLAEAAVCFANSRGGTIVVGVADSASGPAAFKGTTLDASQLRSRIYQLTTPSLLVEVREIRFAEARLLALTVPEGLEVYSTTKGHTYHRVNTDCVPMRPVDVFRLTEERRGTDWSAGPSGRPIEDVDPLSLRYCRRLLASSADATRQRWTNFSDNDLLRALHLVAEDGTLTRTGEILLCASAAQRPTTALVYQHRRTQAGEADAMLRLETPLLPAFEEVSQAIRARQGITPVTLASGQQLLIEDYPTAAVREALVNALVHGDWRTRVPIKIEHSPQYLRITSPGPLVSGVTVDNILTRPSRARFPVLAAAFRDLGLAEEAGQGVDRMYREMIRSGRDIPVIQDDQEEVTVILRGEPPRTRVTRFLSTLPLEEQEDTDTLLIVRLLCEKRSVNATGIADHIQRTPEEAQDALRRLATEPVDMLEPTRGTINRRHPSYRLRASVIAQLGNSVTYHSRATDDVDRKVIQHINDYGEVNNRTIQRLFDVDVYQARDILQSLVGREIIVRSSVQKRGVAVKYSAGPSFPTKNRRKARTENKPEDGTLF